MVQVPNLRGGSAIRPDVRAMLYADRQSEAQSTINVNNVPRLRNIEAQLVNAISRKTAEIKELERQLAEVRSKLK